MTQCSFCAHLIINPNPIYCDKCFTPIGGTK